MSWPTIVYGAALSGILTAVVLILVNRVRRGAVAVTGGLAATVGPLAWNAILHATHASSFLTDAPVPVLPASWQDAGSGVFTVALAGIALAGGLLPTAGRRAAALALVAGAVAFLVDVYLY